jgi:hypothetical protein
MDTTMTPEQQYTAQQGRSHEAQRVRRVSEYQEKVPLYMALQHYSSLRALLKGKHLPDDLRQEIVLFLTHHDEMPQPAGLGFRSEKVRKKISAGKQNKPHAPVARLAMKAAQRDRRKKEYHAHVTSLMAGGDGPKYLRKSLIKQGLIPDTEDRI